MTSQQYNEDMGHKVLRASGVANQLDLNERSHRVWCNAVHGVGGTIDIVPTGSC